MREKLIALRERHRLARTEKERAEVDREMEALSTQFPDEFSTVMVELATETANEAKELVLRDKIKEVLPAISVAYISKTYFGKSRQWLTQRINGSIVNGKPAKLNPDELATLSSAFSDMSRKLSNLRVS